jgi:hypothetical protein
MARKYELETIPIWDAYDQGSECPLCLLEEQAEQRYVEFYLGNSVMVPEMRVEVNKAGFCRDHFGKLWNTAQNRHPLSLITHTHLKDLISHLSAHLEHLAGRGVSLKKLSGRIEALTNHLDRRLSRCLICEKLEYTLERYVFTIVYLWKTKEEFRTAFRESRGVCLHHLPLLIAMASEELHGRSLEEFFVELVELEEKSLERIEGELLWYTQKFDYQNNEKPWGTSKDALHRALQKITGKVYRDR